MNSHGRVTEWMISADVSSTALTITFEDGWKYCFAEPFFQFASEAFNLPAPLGHSGREEIPECWHMGADRGTTTHFHAGVPAYFSFSPDRRVFGIIGQDDVEAVYCVTKWDRERRNPCAEIPLREVVNYWPEHSPLRREQYQADQQATQAHIQRQQRMKEALATARDDFDNLPDADPVPFKPWS